MICFEVPAALQNINEMNITLVPGKVANIKGLCIVHCIVYLLLTRSMNTQLKIM